MTLAEKIRAVLDARELTPYWLAQRSGVALATLDRVLRGTVERPLWVTIQRIAAALEISTDDLRDDGIALEDVPARPVGRPRKPQPAESE